MFAKSLIESVNEVSSKPPKRLKNTLTVDTLAKNSLADVAGVEAGDILLTVNNQPSNSIDLTQASIDNKSIHYTFFRPGKNIAINLKANAAPLGVKFVKSDETVLDEYSSNSDMADHKDLYPIWNKFNSKLLKEITLKEISPFIMSALSLINKLYYSPEYLFYGAALYDMGNREAGMKIIKRFEFCQPETHTQEQDAVVKYYYAKELLHNNEKEKGIDFLMDAFSEWPHKRIQEEIHELTGDYYTFNRYWPGKEFTCGYEFEQVHFGQGTVSFEQAINNMGENQFLLICVMGGYRVNRFYNSFMHRYLSYMKYFSDYIYDLHIITSEPDQENHPDYFVHEKEVIDALGPIKLLNDPEWDICECLEPHGSPTIYAVNKSRNVMYEGELFDCDIWDLINEVNSIT